MPMTNVIVAGVSVARVDRATADVFTGSAVPIYTISGGKIWLFGLVGEVTVIVGSGTTPDSKWQANPSTGGTSDMCATLDQGDAEKGAIFSLTGTPGDAMLGGDAISGTVRCGLWGNPLCIGIGAIEFICDENVTGSALFQAWWAPLDNAGLLVAA